MGLDRIRGEIQQRHGNHESGGERDHVLERADTPAGMRYDRRGADDIRASGNGRVGER